MTPYQAAQYVGSQLHVPGDILYAQWQHETDNFTSELSAYNNFGGITQSAPNDLPQPDGGGYYKKFDSLEDYANYMVGYYKKYDGLEGARTPEEVCAALKNGGYFSADLDEYTAGVKKWLGAGYSPLSGFVSPGENFNNTSDEYLRKTELGRLNKDKSEKPLSFAEGVQHGFESSYFGQFFENLRMHYNARGSDAAWTVSDDDYKNLNEIFKGLPNEERTSTIARIAGQAASPEHLLELIAYEKARRDREQRAEAQSYFSVGALGTLTGSLLNPVNLIPMFGAAGRAGAFAKATLVNKLARASMVGMQTAAWNVADEYGAHVVGGTKFNPKEAIVTGLIAGTGLEMFAQHMGKGIKAYNDLGKMLDEMENESAMKLAGMKIAREADTDINKALDALPMQEVVDTLGIKVPRQKTLEAASELERVSHNKTIVPESADSMASELLSQGKLKIATEANVRKMAEKMGLEVSPNLRAMYIPKLDTIVAVKERIKDSADLEQVIKHEYGVHKGFALLEGAPKERIMNYVQKQIDNPKGLWSDAMKRSKSRDPEEVLAHFIELNTNATDVVPKLKKEVNYAMRKAGFGNVDDKYVNDFIHELAWREIKNRNGYEIMPNGDAVVEGVRFSEDNPLHPHVYDNYVNTVDDIEKQHEMSGWMRKVVTSKFLGSDFGKAMFGASKTMAKYTSKLFRDVYQRGVNDEQCAEVIKEGIMGKLSNFDLEVLDLREQWMRRTDVAKYYGSVGHDNLIMEFNEHVIKYYDNTFGSVKVKKEMKVEPEISQAADVLHDKYLTMLDELSHNKDYLGRGKESNIISENFNTYDESFSRVTDPNKMMHFLNDTVFSGDIKQAKELLKEYGKRAAYAKLEANKKRYFSRTKTTEADFDKAAFDSWLDKEAEKWAYGHIDRDASNYNRSLLIMDENGNTVLNHNTNPLDFLNDRFIADTSFEMALPDGRSFSFDGWLRDYDLDRIVQNQSNRTAGEIGFRTHFNSDEEFLLARAKMEKELNLAGHGVKDRDGRTTIASPEEQRDTLRAFDSMMSKLRGVPITEEIAAMNRGKAQDAIGLLAKWTYGAAGNNIGVSQMAEMLQAMVTNGFEIIPRYVTSMLKGSDMNALRGLVEVHNMKDMMAHQRGRLLSSNEFVRFYGDKAWARGADMISGGLTGIGRITNTLNQLPRLTESFTNTLKASCLKDLQDLAHGKSTSFFHNPHDKKYLAEAGIKTEKDLNEINEAIRKYLPDGGINPEKYAAWRKEDSKTWLRVQKLVEDAAYRGLTRQVIGNSNTAFKSNWIGRLAGFFLNFTYMASHSQFLRYANRPMKDKVAAAVFSAIGGVASYAAYSNVMGHIKYANDEKKREEYLKKKLDNKALTVAALTRGTALAPAAYIQNIADSFGVSPSVRTTTGTTYRDSGAVGRFVSQWPILNTIGNAGESLMNVAELVAYKATNKKHGSDFTQREADKLFAAMPFGNWFGTQLFLETMKQEMGLPSKESKPKAPPQKKEVITK